MLINRVKAIRENAGFTLVELMVTMAIMGILAGIAVPTVSRFLARADYAALLVTLDYVMDGEDAYFVENDNFFPRSGVVGVPRGVAKEIPEIAYAFPAGHKNAYQIYGFNVSLGRWRYNYCYIYVMADFDANNNGADDVFIMLTYYANGETLYNRQLYQLS